MFNEFKKIKPTLYPNYETFPLTQWEPTEENINKFNNIYRTLYDSVELCAFARTPSGGISKRGFFYPSWDVVASNSSLELTICLEEGFFRIQINYSKYIYDENGTKITGGKAFEEFRKVCLRHGINLNKRKIKNGFEIKKGIEAPLISLDNPMFRDTIFKGAHHIDIHSAWPAALTRMCPEFLKPIEEIYQKKEEYAARGTPDEQNIYKAILNCSIGYMQSMKAFHRAAWAHFSKAAINENNRYMRKLAKTLEDSGRVILAFNTDGIWYLGDIYHGENEGPNLGQWENDHTNCQIRFKSGGCYEYIENGKYKPVVRGKTNLDNQLDRSEWSWGDIYVAQELLYHFIPGVGLIKGGYC